MKFARWLLPAPLIVGCSLIFLPTRSLLQEDTREECSDGEDNDRNDQADCDDDNCQKVCNCGNGALDSGTNEECDDGNIISGDGCSEACELEGPGCGDSIIQLPEQCDDGNANSGDGCDSQCQLELCGDGKVDVGEECDDGSRCGSGALCTADDECDVTSGEICDVDGRCGEAGCSPVIKDSCFSGNGLCAPVSLDGCAADCKLEIPAGCGDGVLQPTEECDDQNNVNGDGCDNNCTATGCGNNAVTAGEACDDGNQTAGDGCRDDCLGFEVCLDGHFDPIIGELCDDGNFINGDGCDDNCTFSVCGNGALAGNSEQCDDGNVDNDDGCSKECLIEFCGDGLLNHLSAVPPEQCDDGNAEEGDGCTNDCALEDLNEQEPNEDGLPEVGAASQPVTGNDVDDSAIVNADQNQNYQNGIILASIDPAGDEDVFAIKNPLPQDLFLSLETFKDTAGTCGIDTVLVLRDSTTAVLATDEDGGPDACAAIFGFPILSGQTIYAQVLESGDDEVIGNYVLRIIASD